MRRQNIQAFIDYYRHRGRLEWLDELFQRQTKAGENGCILWTGDIAGGGYGRMRLSRALRSDGRTDEHASPVMVMAHRFAYVRAGGELTQHGHLDHLCRNRACVNVAHLELVSPRENVLRSPISPASINARKTHCKHGHEFTEANILTIHGHRVCRECSRLQSKSYYQTHKPGTPINAVKTHCPQGHEYTDGNTYRDAANHRHCRKCKEEYNARRYAPQAEDRKAIRAQLTALRVESKQLRARLAIVRAEHKRLCKELWVRR